MKEQTYKLKSEPEPNSKMFEAVLLHGSQQALRPHLIHGEA